MTLSRWRQGAAAALASTLLHRLNAEWRATAVYALSISTPRPSGFSAAPRSFRPVDLEVGRQILLGRMTLAGATLEIGLGGDPWDVASPTRAFALELHRFAWLPSLMAQGEDGVDEALRLVLDWMRLFARVRPFVWGAETAERRVFNLACGLRRLSERASEAESVLLGESFARQARHLLRLDDGPLRRPERAAAAAIAGCVLSGKAGARLQADGLSILARTLKSAILPDGVMKSRNPEQGLELLFDLLTLDDALAQRGQEAPAEIARSVNRLTYGVRFFTLGDGRLAAFQGGESASAARVAAALAHDDGDGPLAEHAPHGGYHRLIGRTFQAIVDAAPPAEAGFSLAACAQPLALEIACGADKLIANVGWSPDAQGPQGLRLTAGGSAAGLGEASAGRRLTGRAAKGFGPRLVDASRTVEALRRQNETGVWLELRHDGWVERFGLIHERRLFLSPDLDELRGEDCFTPSAGAQAVRRRPPPYAVRFHLPPGVKVSLARDKRSVLLRGPSNRGWWFRNDAPDVLVEPSWHFEDRTPRRGAQIVLKGPVAEGGARVRWKLTPVEPDSTMQAAR